jgi:hypothetical protein
MNESNIYMRYLSPNFQIRMEELNNNDVLTILTECNPGTNRVVLELYNIEDKNLILDFINKLFKQNITGARLWYIYKNECNQRILDLLSVDLTMFTTEYFYKNLERYF